MADVFATGMSWLSSQLKANAAVTITYRRGAQSVPITATLQIQRLRVSDRQGNSKMERPDAAATFAAADLNFGAGVVEPADGDTFDVAYGAVTKRFRIMPAGGPEASWHYVDPHQTRVIVRAKYVGNV